MVFSALRFCTRWPLSVDPTLPTSCLVDVPLSISTREVLLGSEVRCAVEALRRCVTRLLSSWTSAQLWVGLQTAHNREQ